MTMMSKAALDSHSVCLLWELSCVSRTIEKAEQSCICVLHAHCGPCPVLQRSYCASSPSAQGRLTTVGGDATGKYSPSVLPVGEFFLFGAETNMAFGLFSIPLEACK